MRPKHRPDVGILEPLAVRRDVARRAPIDPRNPHEVDVDEVVGQLHLLHPQGGVDHVQDRRVSELKEGVLLERPVLLPREAEVRGPLLDRRLDILLARVDAVDLGLNPRLVALELGQPQTRRLAFRPTEGDRLLQPRLRDTFREAGRGWGDTIVSRGSGTAGMWS